MATVSGLFRTVAEADRAYLTLGQAGFSQSDISIIARDSIRNVDEGKSAQEVAGDAGAGAVVGGGVGSILGLLASLGAIFIPGVGPVLAAGTLASTLGLMAGGAGVGAAVGGILGAMTSLTASEEDAQVYAEGIKRGAILVAVQADGPMEPVARDILADAGALDPKALRKEWSQAGWTGFQEN